MKLSKYNLIIKDRENNILFNTFSGHCFRISKDIAQKINDNRADEIERETYNSFVERGIIIEDYIDENRYFNYFQNKIKFDNNTISSTVLLTWACNLACVYCYEGAGNMTETMDMSTADRFIGFMIN